MLKRVGGFLLLLYSLSLFTYYVYSLMNISMERREFTKKELFDGPLVMRDNVIVGHGRIVQANVLLNAELLFDQPLSEDSIKSAEHENTTLPVIPEKFYEEMTNIGSNLSSNGTQFIYFTFINQAFERLTLNWLCNTADFENIHKRLLIVSTSSKVCETIHEEWPMLSCLSLFIDGLNEAERWGTKKYVRMLTLRMQLMNALVKASIPFVLFEADSVWFRDPDEFFRNQTLIDDVDIIVPVKWYTHKWDKLTFDPMLAYPTAGTTALFAEIEQRLINDSSLYDQDVMNELCQIQFQGAVCRTFEWDDIADGNWFKRSDRERQDVNPYVVNNNFYVGVENKESRQAINGLWFLSKKKHCVRSKVNRALDRYRMT